MERAVGNHREAGVRIGAGEGYRVSALLGQGAGAANRVTDRGVVAIEHRAKELSITSPVPNEAVVLPSPSCSVPALMVVVPLYELIAVKVTLPWITTLVGHTTHVGSGNPGASGFRPRRRDARVVVGIRHLPV